MPPGRTSPGRHRRSEVLGRHRAAQPGELVVADERRERVVGRDGVAEPRIQALDELRAVAGVGAVDDRPPRVEEARGVSTARGSRPRTWARAGTRGSRRTPPARPRTSGARRRGAAGTARRARRPGAGSTRRAAGPATRASGCGPPTPPRAARPRPASSRSSPSPDRTPRAGALERRAGRVVAVLDRGGEVAGARELDVEVAAGVVRVAPLDPGQPVGRHGRVERRVVDHEVHVDVGVGPLGAARHRPDDHDRQSPLGRPHRSTYAASARSCCSMAHSPSSRPSAEPIQAMSEGANAAPRDGNALPSGKRIPTCIPSTSGYT